MISAARNITGSGEHIGETTIGTTDWNDPGQVADLARRLWRDASARRRGLKAKVFRNLEFVAGNQWHQWNAIREVMESSTRSPWQANIVFNRILPAIETRLARLLGREHVWGVPLQGQDQSDHVVQRLSEDVMHWYWETGLRMPELMQEALGWCMSTGIVFFRTCWDGNAGIPITNTVQDFMAPMMGNEPPDQIQQVQQQAVQKFAEIHGPEAAQAGTATTKSGDPSIEYLPCLDVVTWPWDIVNFKDAQVWCIIRRRSVGEVARKYSMTMDDVRAIQQPPREDDWHRGLIQHWNRGRGHTTGNEVDDERNTDVVYEFELYAPKGVGGFDGGRAAVVLGYAEEAIKLDDIPYPDHELPITWLHEKPVPGKLYGTCTVDQMMSGQVELNTSASQKADYRNRKTNPMIVRIEGDQADDKDFNNRPGAMPKIASKAYAPEVLVMPDISLQHDRDIDLAIRQLNDIGGASGIDYGNAMQDGARSGRAIFGLQQINDQRIRPFADRVDQVMSRVGSLTLALLQEYAVDERILHIVGEDKRIETVAFHRDMIRPSTYGQPGANPAMVVCRSFKNLPMDTGDKWQLIQALMATVPPLLDPIKDRSRILEALGFGEVQEVFDEDRMDKAKANSENTMWQDGQPVGPPSKLDNHKVHFDAHQAWGKTEDYKTAIQRNPMVAQDFDQHIRLHEEGMIRDLLRPQYVQKIADFKEMIDQRQYLDAVAPGLGEQMFPAPMGEMMAMAQQQQGGDQKGGPPSGNKPPPQRPQGPPQQGAPQNSAPVGS